MFDSGPATRSAATSALTVTLTCPVAVMVPMVQDTAPAVTVQTPCVELAERTVSPATAGSETVTPVASDGPSLVTRIV